MTGKRASVTFLMVCGDHQEICRSSTTAYYEFHRSGIDGRIDLSFLGFTILPSMAESISPSSAI
jgi:hypothetical protein